MTERLDGRRIQEERSAAKIEKNRKPESSKQRIERFYAGFLYDYNAKFSELKKLERRFPGGRRDPEILTHAQIIDAERHELHLKLLKLGEQLGKNRNDVWIDVLRKQGTLAGYDLPEFAILKASDFGGPLDDINFDLKKNEPGPLREIREIVGRGKGYKSDEKIETDEVFIVFGVAPIEHNFGPEEDYDGSVDIMGPPDFGIRIRRAEALAEISGGRFLQTLDNYPHESSMKIVGVIIPKERLEKTAAVIRANPKQLRIGEEFYSEEELKEVDENKKMDKGKKE